MANLTEEVAGRATAGDVKQADIEVVADSFQCGGGDGAEVGAFKEKSTDQAVELFYAALVGSPVRTGKEYAARPAQLGGDAGVVGKLSRRCPR